MRIGFKQLSSAITLSFTIMAGSASATELALIISNSNYDNLRGERSIVRNHADLVADFREQGFEVIEGVDLTRLEMQALVRRVDSVVDDLQGIVVLCSTNIVTDGNQTWILPTDISGDSAVDAAFGAPTLDTFLSLAARKPGHGSVFLGVADTDTSGSSTLRSGIGDSDIPQGVLLVSGSSGDISSLLSKKLLSSNEPLSSALEGRSGVEVSGFVSPDHGLRQTDTDVSANAPANWVDFMEEQTLWAVANQSGDRDDLEEYLRRFPNGIYAREAKSRLEPKEPVVTAPTAADIEAALNLSRSERKEVQANLTLLGFDTRGVDGVLGRGSRAAIASWQDSQRFESTGYLTASQIDELRRQADARRLIVEEDDRRYWAATGSSGDKFDLERYLDRYPDGIFADQARAALAEIDARDRSDADSDAWTDAVRTNTADSYRYYLAQYPQGIYAEIAKQRILALDPYGQTDAEEALAKEQEDRLKLNTATKLLIENRLKAAGFDTGRVDGKFDDKTRSAIKRYQRSRGLNDTGYIDPATVRSLLLGK